MLDQKRQAALQALLAKEGLATTETYLIGPRPVGVIPLSFSQERLWYVNQFTPGLKAYNIPVAFRLEGKIDPERLEGSLRRVVERHEALRTAIEFDGNRPYQVVYPEVRIELRIHDISSYPTDRRQAETEKYLVSWAQHRFDLETPSLFEAFLLKISSQDHIFFLNLHHIIADGWSLNILLKELSLFYANPDVDSSLPRPTQYGDFAFWQRQQVEAQVYRTQLNYWLDQLAGDLAPINLPFDHTRTPRQSYSGGWISFNLSSDLSTRARKLSQTENTTLLVILLSAFKILLHRYSGQEDIIVGSPVTNRSRRELEETIGNFINTQVLRTQVNSQDSFSELVRRVRETVLDAYSHQDLPLELLLDKLEIPRNLDSNPLFQTVAFCRITRFKAAGATR